MGFIIRFLLVLCTAFTAEAASAALVMELRPQDFTGTQWPIYQGSLKTSDPSRAYFAPSGTPRLIPSVAGTRHSGIGMNNNVWEVCLGMGGPIAPASITGNNPRTIEVWTFNPSLVGEETLVDLSHRGGTTGQHFAFENGNNWALNGSGTGDVTNWNSSNRQNRWVHLVVTYENGVAKFYVDGVNTVTKECVYNIFSGDSIAIGSQRTAATTTSNSTSNLNHSVYVGYIGNVRIYDNALTQAEVTSRFGLGINGGETPATTYTVSGTVTDGSTGVSGALVYFSTTANASLIPTYVTTTNSSGNYSFSLPAGTWRVAAAKGRYIPNPTPDTTVIVDSNKSGVNFTLTYVTTPVKLIDVDATQLSGNDNDPISSWPNNGTLAGAFGMDGTDTSTRPLLSTTLGKRCVQFDGSNDRLKLLSGSTAITAPAGVTGNSDWTVAGWYLNPVLAETECYLSWANSASQVGERCGLMYGRHDGDGAVMHGASPWLNANMAMIPLPTTGLWHHITVSFDGQVQKVYVNGVLNQTENKNLRLRPAEPFMMGCWFGNSTGGSPNTFYSGSISALTVYDQVLTDAEIYALGYQPVYTISGSVKDNSNQPVSGAIVYFKTAPDASVDPLLVTTTSGTGAFSQQVPPGTWYVSVMKTRYSPNPAPDVQVPVITGSATGVTFTLTPDNTLNKLINLDAANLTSGALTTWTNTGSLGGSFSQDGTDTTTRPTVGIVAGKKAVTFDGSNDRLKASFTAPAGITSGSDWTVSAVIYNPSVSSDETYLNWAQRGTASRGASFCYGSSYSAFHQTNNMAWGVVPTAATWHHIAVTYDGSVEKTYVNGVLSVQSASRFLNIWTGQPVLLGTAYTNATGTSMSQWFSGSIAELHVYDQALNEAEIRQIATVTISGQITDPSGKPLSGAVIGFKSTSKVSAGMAIAATSDADIYITSDGAGNYSLPILKGSSYYVAAWKNGYTPSNNFEVVADQSKSLNIQITKEAGANLAMGKTRESGKLYASPTGLTTSSTNSAVDGNPTTYLVWSTTSQKDLVVDISKPDNSPESIDGVTLLTSTHRVYNWELWVTDNAAPIVNGTRNTSANWVKVYQTTGSFGGYDSTGANGQVSYPVRLDSVNARGVWLKITSSSTSETRILEFMVHSSAGSVSIGDCKQQPDGSPVTISGKAVTWAPRDTNGNRTTDYFYIEDLGRISGIRVKNSSGSNDNLRVNDMVSIAGTMATDPVTGERFINTTLLPAGAPSIGIEPFAMTTKAVQTDPKAIGQLVSVSGKVKQVNAEQRWFTISDGYSDGAESTTRVYAYGIQLPANLASVNDTITVIGVVSREQTGSGVRNVILLYNYNKIISSAVREVTFYATSDTHYGKSGTVVDANRVTIDEMNSLPGTAYPATLGGFVQTPRGVVLSGDLVEGGGASEFDWFALDYGVNGEARVRFPVYEGLGNHDGRVNSPVGQRIQARNTLRRNLTAVSSNGMHYSWDWGGIHFVMCGLSPTDVNEVSLAGDLNYALQFLQEDLPVNVGTSGRPVIIFHHYGFDGFSSGWWSENERTNYYNLIKNYNVVGIVHGHTHGSSNYKWNGIDIYNDGAGQRDPNPGDFLVFRIRPNQLAVTQRLYNTSTGKYYWGSTWTKPIVSPTSIAQDQSGN